MTKIRNCRFLSLLLAILLVVGLVPTAALAAELPEEECHCEECEAVAEMEADDCETEPSQEPIEAEPSPEPENESEAPVSGLMWELDGGLLYIYGNGNIAPFASAEDQPWKDHRSGILEVMFDESADMTIESLA